MILLPTWAAVKRACLTWEDYASCSKRIRPRIANQAPGENTHEANAPRTLAIILALATLLIVVVVLPCWRALGLPLTAP